METITIHKASTAEILNEGITCLLERLGTVETERFISILIREKFDYTKWRRDYFDDMDADDFNRAATNYAKAHPFQPKKPLLPIE